MKARALGHALLLLALGGHGPAQAADRAKPLDAELSALRLSGDSKPASSKPSPAAASLAIASNRDAGDDDDDEEFGRLAHLSGEARLRPSVAASRASEPEPEPSRRRLVPVPGGAYTPGTYLVPGEDAAEANLDAAGDEA